MLKNIYKLILLLLLLLFITPQFSNAVLLGPAQCTDNSTSCGYIANVLLTDSCAMAGNDIDNIGNRILGGQVCYTLGGTDSGGYYMIGNEQPSDNTPYYPYNSPTPPGWTYSKVSNISNYFRGNSIPRGVFQQPGYPYENLRFFDPVPVNISLPQSDDESMVSVGSNYVYLTGCSASVKDVYKSGCPSSIQMGNTSFNSNTGDPISFYVKNILRPNNGYGTWGGGSVSITFGNLTACRSKAYYDWLCSQGDQSSCDHYGYIPTAPGVCSPDVQEPPKPKLETIWPDTGTPTKVVNITPGQNAGTVTFEVSNVGEPGSKMRIEDPQDPNRNPCRPFNPQNAPNLIQISSISDCPTGIDLIASIPSNIKLALQNLLSFFQNNFLIK